MFGIKNGHKYWLCKCQCGGYRECCTSQLIKGKTTSCAKCSFKKMAENKRKEHYLYINYINKGSYIVGITKKGEEFYFDSEDFDKVRKYNWWFNKNGYPITKDKNHKDLFLHRLVIGEKNKTIDHINRKRNDARKSNLRYATRSQNCSNINLRKDNTSKIIGVSKLRGKWQAGIQYKHKKYYLGVYNNFEDAVRARLKAEQKLLREFAPQQHLFNKYNIGGEDIEIQQLP